MAKKKCGEKRKNEVALIIVVRGAVGASGLGRGGGGDICGTSPSRSGSRPRRRRGRCDAGERARDDGKVCSVKGGSQQSCPPSHATIRSRETHVPQILVDHLDPERQVCDRVPDELRREVLRALFQRHCAPLVPPPLATGEHPIFDAASSVELADTRPSLVLRVRPRCHLA